MFCLNDTTSYSCKPPVKYVLQNTKKISPDLESFVLNRLCIGTNSIKLYHIGSACEYIPRTILAAKASQNCDYRIIEYFASYIVKVF